MLTLDDILALDPNAIRSSKTRMIQIHAWTSKDGTGLLETLWSRGDLDRIRTFVSVIYTQDGPWYSKLAQKKKSVHPLASLVARIFRDPLVYDSTPNGRRPNSRLVLLAEILRSMKRVPYTHTMFENKQNNPLVQNQRDPIHLMILTAIAQGLPSMMTTFYKERAVYPTTPYVPKYYYKSLPKYRYVCSLYYTLRNQRHDESLMCLGVVQKETWHSFPYRMFWYILTDAIVHSNRVSFQYTLAFIKTYAQNTQESQKSRNTTSHYLREMNLSEMWYETGFNLLHLALMYGQFDMASTLVRGGVDPRYRFVYDPKPRMPGRTIETRRRIMTTRELFVYIVDRASKTRGLPYPKGSAYDQFLNEIVAMESVLHRAEKSTMPRISHGERVKFWTTNLYKNIQTQRRGQIAKQSLLTPLLQKIQFGSTNTYTPQTITNGLDPYTIPGKVTAQMVNQALAKHMKNHALRAPQLPRPYYWQHVKRPVVLFRGVTGPIQKSLSKHGFYRDKGYVATSINKSVSNYFTRGSGMLLVIQIDSIPKGTPWIWFSPASTPQDNSSVSFSDESEVLLPPGTYRLVKKIKAKTFYATYEPDTSSTSGLGRRIFPAS